VVTDVAGGVSTEIGGRPSENPAFRCGSPLTQLCEKALIAALIGSVRNRGGEYLDPAALELATCINSAVTAFLVTSAERQRTAWWNALQEQHGAISSHGCIDYLPALRLPGGEIGARAGCAFPAGARLFARRFAPPTAGMGSVIFSGLLLVVPRRLVVVSRRLRLDN
jgi:hypothetical protein